MTAGFGGVEVMIGAVSMLTIDVERLQHDVAARIPQPHDRVLRTHLGCAGVQAMTPVSASTVIPAGATGRSNCKATPSGLRTATA